jgi:hypothetical protein
VFYDENAILCCIELFTQEEVSKIQKKDVFK